MKLACPWLVCMAAAASGCQSPMPAASASGGPPPSSTETPPPTATTGAASPAEQDHTSQPDLLEPQQPEAAPDDTRTSREILQVIKDNRPAIRECYEEALKTNPGIEGDLVVQFVIDPAGKVKSAEINWQESDIHVPELEECALARISSFEFPPSSRGLETKAVYPYNFHPGR